MDRSCLVTRLERRLAQAQARHAAAAELQRLTEADQMCGLLLRRYPEGAARSEILGRIVFEDQATDTQQNADFSIQALQGWNQTRSAATRVRHPLVVTTNPSNQDHALRSVGNFRTSGAQTGMTFHAVSCSHETSHRAAVFY